MASSTFIWQEMTSNVMSVSPDAPLQEVASMMRERKFHHMPVIDGDRLVGMLSDRDMPPRGIDLKVKDMMTRNVKTCGLNDKIGHVADLMIEGRVHALPVLDANGKVVGIVTSTDLLKYLRREQESAKDERFEHLVIDLSDIADVED